MIIFDNNFRQRYAEATKKARAEKIRCVRLEPGTYYVARKAAGHGRYIVTVEETNNGLEAKCRTLRGAICPSFTCCVHRAKVYEAMAADGRRKLKNESRAA